MAPREVDFLLIGGGLAAANCARWLREEGADGSVLLVGREPDPPYNRPPLTKDYLRRESSREDVLFRPPSWWEEQQIEVLTRTSVMKLDVASRTATLSTKEEVRFDRALIATGANVRRLRVDGGDLEGIHYVRTFANTDAIFAEAESAERVVCVGGSYIGTEAAASLRKLGKEVAILMQEEVTLDRFYGQEVGGFFQGVLEEHGVEVHGADELERFEGSEGRVTKVISKGGKELACDLVVIGAGVMPDVMLARGAGLDLGEAGGVLCSSRLETSAPGVYAAGDICEYESVLHGGRPLRIEHWDVAFNHGKTAALNMLGGDTPHDTVPYFFSDLADWSSMEYVGPGSGDTVIRGSLDEGDFTAFYVDDGRVTAALTVGRSGDLKHARRFIAEGAKPDPGALADESTDLATLEP
jgi:3-phenylpropionate/trans-cinnamate dioxygenase ferredoxin reductase component